MHVVWNTFDDINFSSGCRAVVKQWSSTAKRLSTPLATVSSYFFASFCLSYTSIINSSPSTSLSSNSSIWIQYFPPLRRR